MSGGHNLRLHLIDHILKLLNNMFRLINKGGGERSEKGVLVITNFSPGILYCGSGVRITSAMGGWGIGSETVVRWSSVSFTTKCSSLQQPLLSSSSMPQRPQMFVVATPSFSVSRSPIQ